MGRMISFLLGLAVLGGIAYWYLQGGMTGSSADREAPTQRMEQVQKKADDLERQLQQQADRAAAQ